MYKAYKFRMYPNQKQRELIHKTFGCTRCGCRNDRDINASINIMFKGLKIH